MRQQSSLVFFFFLVFGLIDLAAYVAVHNRLSYVAQESVRNLATVAGLEGDAAKRVATVNEISAKALEDATQALIGDTPGAGLASINGVPTIGLPPEIQGVSYEDAIQKAPLRVSFDATFNGTLPFLRDVPIRVNAYAFREPRSTLMMPREVDCLGRPFGSSGYNPICECNNPYTPDPSSGMCLCDPDKLSCPTGATKYSEPPNAFGQPGVCKCVCPNGTKEVGGSCECKSTLYEPDPTKPGECRCKTTPTCPANRYLYECQCLCRAGCKGGTLDKNSCACSCPAGKVYNQALDACICATSCPRYAKQEENCGCTCLATGRSVSPTGTCPAIGAE